MTNGENRPRPSLLVFSDDWGRHPSSCQHLVRQLLPGYQVTWVNTIGMRRPALNVATVRRVIEKLGHWTHGKRPSKSLPENLQVVSPLMWPWFSRGYDRRINRRLLARAIRPLIVATKGPVVAVTTIPIVADLVGVLPVDRWVYYCVDDFTEWPGLDQAALKRMDEQLVRRADVIIAVSQTLQSRIASMGRESALLTHGVDLEHWNIPPASMPMPEVEGCERPLVVFWGVIDRRMDVNFIQTLSKEMAKGTIVLAGPLNDPDPALFHVARVRHLPPLPYARLPELAAEAAVLIMPYCDLPVTRAIQPLKMKEYLATGKPVVVRDLPSTRPWGDALDLASSAGEFSSQVRSRISAGFSDLQSASRRRLADESWVAKAKLFEQLALDGRVLSPGTVPMVCR